MVLDVLIVSVALPAMQRELRLSPSGLEWVVSLYALVLAALIPSGGALGDHFGRKRCTTNPSRGWAPPRVRSPTMVARPSCCRS